MMTHEKNSGPEGAKARVSARRTSHHLSRSLSKVSSVSGASFDPGPMSKRPLTLRVRLCYVAAAGLQHCGAAGTTATAAVDDDLDIVSLGAMQPPLSNQAQPSGLGLAGRRRPSETSFGEEESPDQTLSRLLQHTFGALGSALGDSKLDPNVLPAVDGTDGAALTRERSVEGEGQRPASLGGAAVDKLADVVETEPKEEEEGVEGVQEEEKEEEEEGGEGEEEGSGPGTMSLGTGVAPELGYQQEGAVSTESHSGQGSEVGDTVNGSSIDITVVAVTAEHDVDAGIAGDGADAVEAAVALEGVSETGVVLDVAPAPVRLVDPPREPGIREVSGAGLVDGEEVGDAPAGATASGEVEAFCEGGLRQHLGAAATSSDDLKAFGEGGSRQHLEGDMVVSGEMEASSEGGLGQHLEGGTTASEVVEAFSEGGLVQDGEGGATAPGEVAEAVSEGGLGEHRGGGIPATGDLIGLENDIGDSGPVVPNRALVMEHGGLALTPDGTDPIKFSSFEDAGATEEGATSGDAAGTDALAGGGGGGADNAGAGKDSANIDDASDAFAGQAVLEVLELEVEVEKTKVPDGAVAGSLSQKKVAAPPEIDGQAGALEAEVAAPMSDDIQESDASERNVAHTPVLPDDTVIGVVEGSEPGDRSEPHRLVPDVPLAGTGVAASAETTREFQDHSTTAVDAVGGTDNAELLTGDAKDDDETSRFGSSYAPAESSAEGGGAGGQGAVEHGGGVKALEASESAKGGGLPEAGAAAVDIESDGASGGGVGEVAGSRLGGFGESVGSASEPSETGASPEDRLPPGDAPAGEANVFGDAARDAVDLSETSPTSLGGGNDKTAGMGSEGGGREEEPPRERRVFRFSEPPGSRAAGESAGLPGIPGDASSDGAKKFTMPPIKPIDVSPDALQRFRVPEDSPGEAGNEDTEVWSAWGIRWAGVAMEAAVQVAKVAGGRGGTAASSGLQFCKARMMKVWREMVEPRTEHVRLRLETAAMAGLDEVGEHLADPMLAEAI